MMAQALLENALPPSVVDSLFEQHAQLQYTRDLLFSDVVNLMSLVVCRIRPSINAAINKMGDTLTVTKKAVYDKIDRVETPTSAALVRHTGTVFTEVIDALGGRKDRWLAGYRTRILDGSHLPGTEHRIAPLRTTRAGAARSVAGRFRAPSRVGSANRRRGGVGRGRRARGRRCR